MSIGASDVLELSVSERIQLVAKIWDQIAEAPDKIELASETIKLLEKRLADHRRDPDAGSGWPEVKDRILNSKGT